MEHVFQMILHIYFLWLRFLQIELKYTSILWENLKVLVSLAFHILFYFFYGLSRCSILCLLAKLLILLCSWLILFPTLESLTPLYFKYFLLRYLFSSVHNSHPETHKHTSFGRMIMWFMWLFLLLAEWFSRPTETWVQILAQQFTKCMIMGRFNLFGLSYIVCKWGQ